MLIDIKRIYEKPSNKDGLRILVDRLWPRGITKENANIYLWLKELAPSSELRKWFNHESDKWGEFKALYFSEIKSHDNLKCAIDDIMNRKKITLLFSSKEEKLNNATALKEYLESLAETSPKACRKT